MKEAMKEKGIDMAYRKPKSVEEAALFGKPDLIVSMGCKDVCPQFPGVPNEEWNVPDPFAVLAKKVAFWFLNFF
jgi:protein-tyrosine-phosphatase